MSVIMLKTDSSPISALIFEHFESLIRATDTKAQLIIAINTLLAAAVSLSEPGLAPAFPSEITSKDFFVALFSFLVLVGLIVSVYFSLQTIRPAFSSGSNMVKSMFYFGYVNTLDEKDFVKQFASQNAQQIQNELLSQVYAKSKIVERKFRQIRHSVNALYVTLVIWSILQLIQMLV